MADNNRPVVMKIMRALSEPVMRSLPSSTTKGCQSYNDILNELVVTQALSKLHDGVYVYDDTRPSTNTNSGHQLAQAEEPPKVLYRTHFFCYIHEIKVVTGNLERTLSRSQREAITHLSQQHLQLQNADRNAVAATTGQQPIVNANPMHTTATTATNSSQPLTGTTTDTGTTPSTGLSSANTNIRDSDSNTSDYSVTSDTTSPSNTDGTSNSSNPPDTGSSSVQQQQQQQPRKQQPVPKIASTSDNARKNDVTQIPAVKDMQAQAAAAAAAVAAVADAANRVEQQVERAVAERQAEEFRDLSEEDRMLMEALPTEYVVTVMRYDGQPLWWMITKKKLTAQQMTSVLVQVIIGIAIAERVYLYEHRDLHVSNILVKKTSKKKIPFVLDGHCYSVLSNGVKATIIDATFSRLSHNGKMYYRDLTSTLRAYGVKKPPSKMSLQNRSYREMVQITNNNWEEFKPKTNLIWLTYLCETLMKNDTMRENNLLLGEIRKIRDYTLKVKNTFELLGHFPFERAKLDDIARKTSTKRTPESL